MPETSPRPERRIRPRPGRRLAPALALALAGLAAAGAVGCGPRARPEAPPLLNAITEDTRALLDRAYAGDLAGADSLAKRIRDDWATLKPRARKAGVPEETLAGMDNAMARLRDPVVRLSARRLRLSVHRVDLLLPDVYAAFAPPEVVEAVRLDVYGRTLILAAERADFGNADSLLAKIRLAWQGLRPEVMKRKEGGSRAAEYDRLLADMGAAATARDPVLLQDAATRSIRAAREILAVVRGSRSGRDRLRSRR